MTKFGVKYPVRQLVLSTRSLSTSSREKVQHGQTKLLVAVLEQHNVRRKNTGFYRATSHDRGLARSAGYLPHRSRTCYFVVRHRGVRCGVHHYSILSLTPCLRSPVLDGSCATPSAHNGSWPPFNDHTSLFNLKIGIKKSIKKPPF